MKNRFNLYNDGGGVNMDPKKNKDKEEWVSDPRRFFMPLGGMVIGHKEISEEEKKRYKKILMSFIDGSRLDNKNND